MFWQIEKSVPVSAMVLAVMKMAQMKRVGRITIRTYFRGIQIGPWLLK
jgi:hypothetical protein